MKISKMKSQISRFGIPISIITILVVYLIINTIPGHWCIHSTTFTSLFRKNEIGNGVKADGIINEILKNSGNPSKIVEIEKREGGEDSSVSIGNNSTSLTSYFSSTEGSSTRISSSWDTTSASSSSLWESSSSSSQSFIYTPSSSSSSLSSTSSSYSKSESSSSLSSSFSSEISTWSSSEYSSSYSWSSSTWSSSSSTSTYESSTYETTSSSTYEDPTTSESIESTSETTSTTSTNGLSTIIINLTTTITQQDGLKTTSTTHSTQTSTPTLSSTSIEGSNNSKLSKKTKNIIIGVCVGIGTPLVIAFIGIVWFKYRSRKNFLNSEGEIVRKEKGPEGMIDDEYFDETINDAEDGGHVDRDVNRAVNF